MSIVFRGKTKKGRDIIVRYPEIGDVEKMLQFINEASEERTFISSQGEKETLESETKYLKDKLKTIKEAKSVQLLAFCNNELVGESEIHMMDKVEKHIGIFGITIRKGFRGEGMGKLLMDLVLKEAKGKIPDIRIVTLDVFSTNSIAKDLYKKMGFVEYGMLPEGIYRNGQFEDSVLMYKKLS